MRRFWCSLVVLVACGGRERTPPVETPPPEPPTAPAPAEPPVPEAPAPPEAPEAPSEPQAPPADGAPFEGTAGIVDVRHPGAPATLVAVRTGRHAGYDRVVFELADRVPGYHLEYVDRPVRACGSGEVVPVAGDGWLEVRLDPAQAHDDQGHATVAERDVPTPDLANVRQVVSTCDFEGHVTWVIGTGSPNRYRVSELDGPPRLVVDVRQ